MRHVVWIVLLALCALTGCSFLAPVAERGADFLDRYCEEPQAERLIIRDSINSKATPGNSIRATCAGDAEEVSELGVVEQLAMEDLDMLADVDVSAASGAVTYKMPAGVVLDEPDPVAQHIILVEDLPIGAVDRHGQSLPKRSLE